VSSRWSPMKRRIVLAVVALALVGGAGFFVLAWRPAIAPIEPPARTSFSPELVRKGEVLAAEAHCASCHTGPGGETFAGGYAVNTSFGVFYGNNITPDSETGIGHWSLEAFKRAMHEGVSRDGSHLFPAFPYWSFTGLSDEDVEALYAYMMTRPPVRGPGRKNTIPFPLNVKALQAGWKLLFFKNERFKPDPTKSAEWNRGAYLSEAAGDCAGCHTTRNVIGGAKRGGAYAGNVIDGWIAPALTERNPAPVPWSEQEVFTYLRTGATALHGTTSATMTPVIRDALDLPVVPDSDVRAIALYFSEMANANARAADAATATADAMRTSALGSGQEFDPDADLYAGACIGCHYNAGPMPLAARPELALNSSLVLDDPTNFIQVVLRGVGADDGARGLVMPAYASSLTDAEIARLANYLRRTRTRLPPWNDLEAKSKAIRRQLAASH